MRRSLASVGLLVAAVACTKGSDAFVTPAKPVPSAAPILSVVMAADVGTDGAPVAPARVFSSDAPAIAVVIRIGDVDAGSRITVAWSFEGGPKATPLFTHTIDVAPGDTAFSKGVSTGVFLQGKYRVDVGLGDAEVSSSFMVLADASAVTTGVAETRVSVMLAETSAPPSPPEPPTSGDSGTIPPTASTGSSTGAGCELTLTGGGNLYVTMDTTGCQGDVTTGAAGGQDGALTIIDPSIQGDNLRFWNVDPCKVGGSDLPGSEIRYAALVTKGHDKGLRRELTATVGPDKDHPFITFTSTPAVGDFALPGMSIQLQAEATDGNSSGIAATGIAEITITDPNGKVIGDEHFDGPEACDMSRLGKQASATYMVPQGAPPIVELTITAKDFAGNGTTLKARYTTVPSWDGVIVAKTAATGPGYNCHQTWQATFEMTLKDGAVSGTGAAEPNAPPSCPLAAGAPAATHEEFSVSGTFDGRTFELQIEPTGGLAFDTGFHVLWFPKPVTIEVPWGVGRKSGGTADLNITNSEGELAGVPATATLDGYIQLLLKNQ